MRIHFIGICGVGMSALAIACKNNNWIVTGSDVGFYPPVSDSLKNAGVSFYPGWHPEKMQKPDLVVVGNVAGSSNPEWLAVQEQKIPYTSYPEFIRDYLIAKNSIVVAGTYGKTTSSTIPSWILSEAGYAPNYMFGGVTINDFPPGRISENAQWSVVEGDEYKTARWDNRPKFTHYSPTHLLLTSVVWDHADLYPTDEAYGDAFDVLMKSIPEDGVIVVSEKVNMIGRSEDRKITRYGASEKNDYQYTNVRATKDGTTFKIIHKSQIFNLQSSILGDFSADNLTGCFAMAHRIGIEPEKIIEAIGSFKGIKRRLECRHRGAVDVYDDIAHSPQKAKAILQSLKKLYTGRPIAVFEPNTGNRKEESFPGYDNAFVDADMVILPRLTAVKIAEGDPTPPVDGDVLTKVIAKTHKNVQYMEDDEVLVKYLANETKEGDCIVFLGSHGFRGMIESLTQKI